MSLSLFFFVPPSCFFVYISANASDMCCFYILTRIKITVWTCSKANLELFICTFLGCFIWWKIPAAVSTQRVWSVKWAFSGTHNKAEQFSPVTFWGICIFVFRDSWILSEVTSTFKVQCYLKLTSIPASSAVSISWMKFQEVVRQSWK